MVVMTRDGDASSRERSDLSVVKTDQGQVSVATLGFGDAAELRFDDGRVGVAVCKRERFAAGNTIVYRRGDEYQSAQAIREELTRLGDDLRPLTKGGPAQYSTAIEVPTKKWFESDAWAVDELVRPEGNPWLARTRVTGIDFYPAGDSMAVCTWDGDVWRVDGLANNRSAGRRLALASDCHGAVSAAGDSGGRRSVDGQLSRPTRFARRFER